MTISESLLRILLEPKHRHHRVWVRRAGLPAVLPYTKKTITDTLSHLKKKRYILFESDSVRISAKGKQYLKRTQARLQMFDSPFSTAASKNLLLIFDIPESRKTAREWLRRQLQVFGYVMIQKSVWVGPSPLPREFIAYVKAIQLKSAIHTFKIAKGNSRTRVTNR